MIEEKRLAAAVRTILYDTLVVPRGAYYRDSSKKLAKNPDFSGKINVSDF
jgi:hypothetical protein